ncbi:hypothetical protein [Photobacterium damselae]
MLQAIVSNKSGRIEINGENLSIWQLYKDREDMLTATVISRLGYLSDLALQEVMQFIFSSSSNDFSQLDDIEFWPRFESSFQQYVEPDVICHFPWGIVVIEAKRPMEDGIQYAEQWRNELEALPSEYKEGEIYFLALGGSTTNYTVEKRRLDTLLLNSRFDTPRPTMMAHLTWETLAKFLVQTADNNEWSRSDVRIVNDILAALHLYGVNTSSFTLDSLASQHFTISNSSLNYFKAMPVMPLEAAPMKVEQLKITNIQWDNAVNIFNQFSFHKGA